MPVEATPLFRPEVIRPHVAGFDLPDAAVESRARLTGWVELLDTPKGSSSKETELLPDYLTDVFHRILGYRGPAEREDGRHTISREKLVQDDGKFADAVLGSLGSEEEKFLVAVEGKGPRDPLDRPFGGRRMSAVDQAYRYAINLPCDWLIVTNLREFRLYHKGSTQRTYERFQLVDLVEDDFQFQKFVFLLGADCVTPAEGRSHLYGLMADSDRADDRLTQEFYRAYAGIRHDLLNALLEANPDVVPRDVLAAAQRLLDRVLFVAFAEDRSLLPQDSLAKAYQHRDPYNPRPIWDNFLGLFRAIDEGNQNLGIPKYNGGLFAPHDVLDRSLVVPDEACLLLKRLGDYNYGHPGETDAEAEDEHLVDVEILGHIFEQSIEDLEAIRSEIEGGGDVSRATSRRKREGAFYTPDYVTRYIVTEALEPVLSERFENIRSAHQTEATGTSIATLEDPRAYDIDDLNNPQRDALIAFWEAWIEELKTIRVLDPACGSGAFLIEVFDALHAEYQQAVGHLTDLRRGGFVGSLLDPDRTILENNVYGVDLNEEAVEIARLSIWIKTAARGKVLTDLDHNVQVGNSIIDDPELEPRAFDWWGAFPEVEEQGGFDVVVGNPPYVRAELFTDVKPYLEDRYDAYHGAADLYVYFFENGVRLLRPGGRLSYIVTNKWLKTGYAGGLRAFFAERTAVEEVVDLGHARGIFPDADVFPSILRLRKTGGQIREANMTAVSVIPRDELGSGGLAEQIRSRAFVLDQAGLSSTPWALEPPQLDELWEKVRQAGPRLPEFVGTPPRYGIKTGANKVFVVDQQTRDRLVREDASSNEILKECIRGNEIDRWIPSRRSDREWLIFARRGVRIGDYPAVHRYLLQYKEQLRPRPRDWLPGERWPGRKPGAYEWYELQDAVDYWQAFKGRKILHTDIAWRPQFALSEEPLFALNTAYAWETQDLYVLGVLNSSLLWSYMWRHAQHGKDEALRLIASFIQTIPIAEPSPQVRSGVESRVADLIELSRERQSVTGTLHDWLKFEFGVEKPGSKLSSPHEIDSDSFVAEVKKRRAGDPTVTAAELRRLREEFDSVTEPLRRDAERVLELETQISDLVNQAYGLTPEEVKLLWDTAPPRMPQVKKPEESPDRE